MYCCNESLQSFSISCVDLNIECVTQVCPKIKYEGFVHACQIWCNFASQQTINVKEATIIIGIATSL